MKIFIAKAENGYTVQVTANIEAMFDQEAREEKRKYVFETKEAMLVFITERL